MTRRGLTIALSGVDCSGKSTQRDLLMTALRSWGEEPVTIWTRAGSTPGLKAFKRVVFALTGKKKRDPGHVADKPGRYPRRAANLPNPLERRVWLTTAILDLAWVYVVKLRWWRWCGRTIVCDRYLLDCLVDFRVNFPDDRVEERLLCRFLRRFSVRPDVAFCLLVPAELTMERSRNKARFHWETLEVLQRRREEYGTLSEALGVQALDGCRPVDEIARALQQRVADAASSTRTVGSASPGVSPDFGTKRR